MVEPIELRRSSSERRPVSSYIPSMSGSKYGEAVTQLSEDGVIFPEAHAFLQHEFYDSDPVVVATVMSQESLKSEMKLWDKDSRSAAEAEICQLHWCDSFKPVHWMDLSDKEKQMVLESHILVTKKRDGQVKGRQVSGGNKQRNFIEKEDSSSPTVATESVLLSATIDAMEKREVCVVKIPNAFVQT